MYLKYIIWQPDLTFMFMGQLIKDTLNP